MAVFEYVLILLGAVFVSNILGRFFPKFSVSMLQILLGIGIALLPIHFHLEFEPELFFVLFIAPLLFYNSLHIDRVALWQGRKSIFSLAFGLVFISILAGGFLVHALIPLIPVAAACALIAILGPTDDVAMANLARRLKLPYGLVNILEGESIFNDSAGIVSFQFAVAAVMTGVFSPLAAGWQFLLVSVGGLAVGLLLTGAKIALVQWTRSLGIENMTLHLLVELMSPFIIFMVAEHLHVSGVFAVFIAGVAAGISRKSRNPEVV